MTNRCASPIRKSHQIFLTGRGRGHPEALCSGVSPPALPGAAAAGSCCVTLPGLPLSPAGSQPERSVLPAGRLCHTHRLNVSYLPRHPVACPRTAPPKLAQWLGSLHIPLGNEIKLAPPATVAQHHKQSFLAGPWPVDNAVRAIATSVCTWRRWRRWRSAMLSIISHFLQPGKGSGYLALTLDLAKGAAIPGKQATPVRLVLPCHVRHRWP